MSRPRQENAADLVREQAQRQARQDAERCITARVIEDALQDETVQLSVEGFDDPPRRDRPTLLDDCLAVDEACLYFHREGGSSAYAWVRFVLGNSGWDVICDHSTNLTGLLQGANLLAEAIETERTDAP